MINNDIANHLNRYFNNNSASASGNGLAGDVYKKLKARHDTIHGRTDAADDAKQGANTATTPDASLSAEERRQKELQAILDKINAEDAAVAPAPANAADSNAAQSGDNFLGFLNDLPLFNEFKAGLVDAFTRLDSASSGSISAQYELNYTAMQYVADAAGNFSYKETSVSIKLDLNYVKAAAGDGAKGKSLAELLGGAQDMSQLVDILGGSGKSQKTSSTSPTDFMAGLKDYFSPEKTAGRIVDFCTAFFPASDAFKAGGDTEEARGKFAEMMRAAVQKGFDQAMGTLGKVPQKVRDDIDKTHELTFKGIDDFVTYGMDRNKQNEGVYSALEQLAFSFQYSYSEKTVSAGSGSYTQAGASKDAGATQAALDTQA